MKTKESQTLKDITNDLKYLTRLTSRGFRHLLYPTFNPDSADLDYIRNKWLLFSESPLRFIWSCSEDKLEIISQYIQDCKGGEE